MTNPDPMGRLFIMATFRDLLAAAKSEIVEVDTDEAASRIDDGALEAGRLRPPHHTTVRPLFWKVQGP